MKILVIGGGGREHALVWKLKQSASVEKIWCAPGNGGISADAECFPVAGKDVAGLVDLAERLGADLTVVGPEQPLVLGLADELTKHGLAVVGPSQQAAEVEGSKVFAKEFLGRHGIPTAAPYGIYDSAVDAYSALCAVDWPVVVKADGLCGGKGVLVTSSPDEATTFIERLMERREFGEAGKQILLEEGLAGQELSYIVLTDGETILPMAPARDHKRIFDGDVGPNTGGMGAFSTDELVSAELEEILRDRIVEPTVAGLASEGRRFRGFLYFGLMITRDGPKVLEFNCRMGDPETQAILMRADFDLAEALQRTASGKLAGFKARWKPKASICVVLAAPGYPGPVKPGQEIEGLESSAGGGDKVVVFHAGTRREGDKYYTSGGRVFGVSGSGGSVDEARDSVYDAISKIHFEGCQYRTDIGRPIVTKRAARD
jgi:phosphoribosylamine--glycine ligase